MEKSEAYDEGLGTVYERFILNQILKRIKSDFGITSVLEVPHYGMTGVEGLNSVVLAAEGCDVTVVDWDEGRLATVRSVWKELKLSHKLSVRKVVDYGSLPFADRSYDLAWNFAALWHVKNGFALVEEMCRVASKTVFICVPNRIQPGYLVRKMVDRRFFKAVDEKFIDLQAIKSRLIKNGLRIVEEGFFDIPPWPDTCLPIKKVTGAKRGWNWSIIDYYKGRDPELERKVGRYAFMENTPLPKALQSLWAHHRYVIARK